MDSLLLRGEPRADAERHRSLAAGAEEPGERRAARQRGKPRQPRALADLEERRQADAVGGFVGECAGDRTRDRRSIRAMRHACGGAEGTGVLVGREPAAAGPEALGEAEERSRRCAGRAHAGGERRPALRALAWAHRAAVREGGGGTDWGGAALGGFHAAGRCRHPGARSVGAEGDRKSTRLNSSHLVISYAVFCLKKKKKYILMVVLLMSHSGSKTPQP